MSKVRSLQSAIPHAQSASKKLFCLAWRRACGSLHPRETPNGCNDEQMGEMAVWGHRYLAERLGV